MVKMPKELINLLKEWHTIPVATVGKDGKPNVAGKSVMVRDNETIIWGELYFMQTYENLKQNPVASICVWGRRPPFKAYKINGRVEVHEDDELAAQMDERVRIGHEKVGFPMHGHEMPKPHPMFKPRREKMAAVVFMVEEIYDQTPSLEAGGKRIS
ncbi:MAG: pyridoxamine 5'-phosphate oxidase family protein [Candidatus Bathyarchaeota archaeon]|nr:pyridoxamine 5'-phosphate oxidase family protein [Candidatus Bathyarchaeota archaeon]